MIFELHPIYRELIAREIQKCAPDTLKNSNIDIGQFERYTFIKSLNFIRFRPREKQSCCAKVLSYNAFPKMHKIGMLDCKPRTEIQLAPLQPSICVLGKLL